MKVVRNKHRLLLIEENTLETNVLKIEPNVESARPPFHSFSVETVFEPVKIKIIIKRKKSHIENHD